MGLQPTGPVVQRSPRVGVPQHLVAAGRFGVRMMWVKGVVHCLWTAFSGRACSPGLVLFCVPRATSCSSPCPSPVGSLGLRLGRGHFCYWIPCFPPLELPSEFLIRP